MAQTTTFTATISRINDHGFQTSEDPGRWYNISKYAKPEPAIPPKGTAVRLTIDGAGFIRAIEPLAVEPAARDGAEPRQDAPAPVHPGPASRETVITRLACLKAAGGFLATRPDAKSADVLAVAASWADWVTRDQH
jgi:hypothetical protein